jgi:hypothetical protein
MATVQERWLRDSVRSYRKDWWEANHTLIDGKTEREIEVEFAIAYHTYMLEQASAREAQAGIFSQLKNRYWDISKAEDGGRLLRICGTNDSGNFMAMEVAEFATWNGAAEQTEAETYILAILSRHLPAAPQGAGPSAPRCPLCNGDMESYFTRSSINSKSMVVLQCKGRELSYHSFTLGSIADFAQFFRGAPKGERL